MKRYSWWVGFLPTYPIKPEDTSALSWQACYCRTFTWSRSVINHPSGWSYNWWQVDSIFAYDLSSLDVSISDENKIPSPPNVESSTMIVGDRGRGQSGMVLDNVDPLIINSLHLIRDHINMVIVGDTFMFLDWKKVQETSLHTSCVTYIDKYIYPSTSTMAIPISHLNHLNRLLLLLIHLRQVWAHLLIDQIIFIYYILEPSLTWQVSIVYKN